MLELFFKALILNDNQIYIVEIFKVFVTLLSPHNMNLLLDTTSFFHWLDNLYRANILNEQILSTFNKLISFDFQKSQKQSKCVEQLKRNLVTSSSLESWIEHFFG